MKIAIIGYSGSGKSTLATKLGRHYHCEVLHLDSVHFSEGWAERSDEDMINDTKAFMKKENWVIEGNYSRTLYQERMEQADQIIFMNFSRIACLWRAYRRYQTYKGKTRPDMANGCNEKFDREFVCWILKKGRTKAIRKRYQNVVKSYPEKVVILRNQRELNRFLKTLGKCQLRRSPHQIS